MQKIHLIRHGQTEANERHLYCGSSDLPLSDAGAAALRALAVAGGYPEGRENRLCISGMLRTRQTAAILFGDLPCEVLPDFREIDFGAFELHSYDELKDRADYQAWLSGDNERNRCPGGESGVDMVRRVLPAFRALLVDGRDTILVSHGGVIAAILDELYPQSGKSRYEWQPQPGYGWTITMEAGQPVDCVPIPAT